MFLSGLVISQKKWVSFRLLIPMFTFLCMLADIAWNGNDEELLRKLSCFALFEDSLPLPSAIHLCWMEKGGGKKSNIKLLRVDFNGNFCLRKSNGTSCAKGECWRVGLRLDVFRKIVDTVWKWYFYEAMTLGMSKHEKFLPKVPVYELNETVC